ncbi:MAG: hypothetical protein KDD42_02135, partial [Bdellovibrionales bacterium]|nr:hypothetical protein [Bdellovibrionales bacterium]
SCDLAECAVVNNSSALNALGKIARLLRKYSRRAAGYQTSCLSGPCSGDVASCQKRQKLRLRAQSSDIRKANKLYRENWTILSKLPSETLNCIGNNQEQ